jgi:very-short-patch-repair endonuclease
MLPAMDAEQRLAHDAQHQHGLVTRAQVRAAGLSARQVTRRLERGRWQVVRRGVYAGGWVPPSWEQAVLAVVLAVGQPCAASRATAARLWDLPIPRADAIDVLTLSCRRVRLEAVHQQRVDEYHLEDVTVHRRIPVTTVARTLVDCAPGLSAPALGRAVDEALRRKLLQVPDLVACVDRLPPVGRRRLVGIRQVLAERVPGYRPVANDWERWLARVLHDGGLRAPVRQLRVDVGGRRRFLDFAYPSERIGIEFDGFAEHGLLRSTFDDDRARGNDLRLAGWLVLHFTSRSSARDIVETVDRALRQRRSA